MAEDLKQQLADKTAECSSLKEKVEELQKKLEQALKLVGESGKADLLAKIPGGLGAAVGDGSKEEDKPVAESAKEAAEDAGADAADAAKTALSGKLGGFCSF